jgi:hypothetical protein
LLTDIIGSLYDFVRDESKASRKGVPSKHGYEFENKTSRKIHDLIQGHGVTKRPPRTEFEYPSFSGIKHPFDNLFFLDKVVYPIECKAAAHQIEHLYAFLAKMVDHALGFRIQGIDLRMRGIFLSTTELGRNARAFAFAYGMIPIDPVIPPLEYMIQPLRVDDGLRDDLQRLCTATTTYLPDVLDSGERGNGVKLEETFDHCYRRWKARDQDRAG